MKLAFKLLLLNFTETSPSALESGLYVLTSPIYQGLGRKGLDRRSQNIDKFNWMDFKRAAEGLREFRVNCDF